MYDPVAGQYISRDSLGYASGQPAPSSNVSGRPADFKASGLVARAVLCEKAANETDALVKHVADLVKKFDDNDFQVRQKASEDLLKLAKGREQKVLEILKGAEIAAIIKNTSLEVLVRVDHAITDLMPPPPPPPPPGQGKGGGKGGGPPPGGGKGPGNGGAPPGGAKPNPPPPPEIFA